LPMSANVSIYQSRTVSIYLNVIVWWESFGLRYCKKSVAGTDKRRDD
jgi:hypothetical protein